MATEQIHLSNKLILRKNPPAFDLLLFGISIRGL